jgi:hypothetical protein
MRRAVIIKAKTFFVLLLILISSASAIAGQQRVSLRPNFKNGQQDRYAITSSVDRAVKATGANGIESRVRRELTAIVVIETVEAAESHISQRVIIESAELRETIDGVEVPAKLDLAGQKLEFTWNRAGKLLKASIPHPASSIELAELVSSLAGWFPSTEVAVGQSWRAEGQGPIYSNEISDIAKASSTVYRLAAAGETVSIEGDITLKQSGAALLTVSGSQTNVNVIAAGKGVTRFDYDAANSRMIHGTTETRVEGRLANIPPSAAGEKMRPREGLLVETSKYSIKLLL